MSRVLLVEDEPALGRTLALNLTGRGYDVDLVASGRHALESARETPPDIVLLDLGLPDVDGTTVLGALREERPTLPVLVLSARTSSVDKVRALDLGAIDYVTKPFDVAELLARLRVALRRTEPPSPLVRMGPVTVDLDSRLATRRPESGDAVEPVHLTPTEWRMLETLLRRPGALVAGRELLTAMRGGPEHTDRSYLRIYMQQLRRKLEVDPSRPRHLVTEQGAGYRFLP